MKQNKFSAFNNFCKIFQVLIAVNMQNGLCVMCNKYVKVFLFKNDDRCLSHWQITIFQLYQFSTLHSGKSKLKFRPKKGYFVQDTFRPRHISSVLMKTLSFFEYFVKYFQ